MGMLKCQDHGLEYITTCCEHILDAANARMREVAHVALDDWVTPTLVCTSCKQLIDATDRGASAPTVGLYHVLECPIHGYCYMCLKDWFASTNQGDLSQVIDRMRTPYLKRSE